MLVQEYLKNKDYLWSKYKAKKVLDSFVDIYH